MTDHASVHRMSRIETAAAVLTTAVCALLLWLQVKHSVKLDSISVALVGLALVPWVLPYIKELKISASGVEIVRGEVAQAKKEAAEARESAEQAVKTATVARGAALHGVGKRPRLEAEGAPLAANLLAGGGGLSSAAVEDALSALSSDPHKGKFGGSREADNWTLTGRVNALADSTEFFEVRLSVSERNHRAPSPASTARFHLHPTFSPQVVDVPIQGGLAEIVRYAWGAFTVGVEILPDGPTLELDLAELPDAPGLFRSR